MSDLSAPKKARPTVTFEKEPGSPKFNMLCHDMYKRFGACYTNLRHLATTESDRQLLFAQLPELRTEVRELLEKARGT